MGPLVGAVAAGNVAVVKPSEVSEHTEALLKELVPKYLDPEAIKIITGGVPETTALLKERFDYIFYTGNNVVAKIIYKAAAEHLTPVTLELGGKSPVFVNDDVDIGVVARRIAWGKFVNAGQTCIAPDYIMCTPDTQDRFVEAMQSTLKDFFGDDVRNTDDFCRLVSARQFQRVKKLIETDKSHVAIGGETEEDSLFISPTILKDVPTDAACMQQEIFGPVLPIVPVKSVDEAVTIVNGGEKPLAMYIFANNQPVIDKLIGETSSGGVCINDTLMHTSIETLPFGGVGHSGIGAYHGKFSFDTFSHKRACMHRSTAMEKLNDIRYPPYTDKKLDWGVWLMKKSPKKSWFGGGGGN